MRHYWKRRYRKFFVITLFVVLLMAMSAPAIAGPGYVYTVQYGDTLYSIARQFNTSVATLALANDIANPGVIYVGQQITIYDAASSGGSSSATASATASGGGTAIAAATANVGGGGYYVVQRGDTMYSIALRHGLSLYNLIAANNVPNPSLIYAGQTLAIPGGGSGAAALAYASGGGTASATATADTGGAYAPSTTYSGGYAAPANVVVPSSGSVARFTVNSIGYSEDGRTATLNITMHNISALPGMTGGRYHVTPNPDGSPRWVTHVGASQIDIIPQPLLGGTPLPEFRIYLSDGNVYSAAPGCIFNPDGSQMFYCAYGINPHDLQPGESASTVLTAYLVSPYQANDIPERRIIRIEFYPKNTLGQSLGLQDTVVYP